MKKVVHNLNSNWESGLRCSAWIRSNLKLAFKMGTQSDDHDSKNIRDTNSGFQGSSYQESQGDENDTSSSGGIALGKFKK